MKLKTWNTETGPGEAPQWLLWTGFSQSLLEPFSMARWEELLGDASPARRIFSIGSTECVELRKLEGRGWRGRVGYNPERHLQTLRYAGNGTFYEPRLNARRAVTIPDGQSAPDLVVDSGILPDSMCPAWLPFLAKSGDIAVTGNPASVAGAGIPQAFPVPPHNSEPLETGAICPEPEPKVIIPQEAPVPEVESAPVIGDRGLESAPLRETSPPPVIKEVSREKSDPMPPKKRRWWQFFRKS